MRKIVTNYISVSPPTTKTAFNIEIYLQHTLYRTPQ